MSRASRAMKPFPFIVGCGRSGTTLLRAMFDSHPELAVPPETYFVAGLLPRRRAYERGDGFDAASFTSDVVRYPRFAEWGFEAPDVRAVLHGSRSYAAAVRSLYALYAGRDGKTRYADKTPKNVRRMPSLASMFPEARFIHLIRDGRDVALSLREMPWGPSSVAGAAVHWRRNVEKGRRGGARLGPGRYLEVRYEALVADPEAVLRSLCNFVDLEYQERMLRYHERPIEDFSGTARRSIHMRLSLPPTLGLREWRIQMPPQDIVTFERYAGDLLGRLGYERRHPNFGISPTIRARRAVLVRDAKRLGRKALHRRRRPLGERVVPR